MRQTKGIRRLFMYSDLLSHLQTSPHLSCAHSSRLSLFLIVHTTLFFLPGTYLPSALRVPGSGESALIFSSHSLVGPFFFLESLFSLNIIPTTKRLPASPRVVFLALKSGAFLLLWSWSFPLGFGWASTFCASAVLHVPKKDMFLYLESSP